MSNPRLAKYTLTQKYFYRDADGQIIQAVVRFDHPSKPKEYRQASRLPDKTWKPKGIKGQRPLYHLSRVLQWVAEGKTIYIVEGEKAAEALIELGLCATTSLCGAHQAHLTDWSPLAGARIKIWPDADGDDEKDKDGEKYKNAVLQALAALSPQPRVRLVSTESLADKQDAADLEEDDIRARIKAATPCALPEPATAEVAEEAHLRCMADIEATEVNWVWHEKIAIGKLNLIAGDPGLGKSTITLYLAARVTTGEPFPFDDGPPRKPKRVIIVAAEDAMEDTVKPRLLAAGADQSRVYALNMGFTLQNIDRLEQALKNVKDCGLVIIDPLMAYMGDRDSFKDAEVRSLLAPLAQLAEKYKVAILLVAHLNKSKSGKASHRVGGSIGIIASARIAWVVAKKPGGTDGERILAPLKSNICADNKGLSYKVVPSATNRKHPCIEWGGIETMDTDSILEESSENGSADLDNHLKAALEKTPDGLSFKVLAAMAQESFGYGRSAARTSLNRIGADNRKSGFGKGGSWLWTLPAAKTDPATTEPTPAKKPPKPAPDADE